MDGYGKTNQTPASFQVLASLRLRGLRLVRNPAAHPQTIIPACPESDGAPPNHHSDSGRALTAQARRKPTNPFTGRMVRTGGKPKAGEQGSMEEKAKPAQTVIPLPDALHLPE